MLRSWFSLPFRHSFVYRQPDVAVNVVTRFFLVLSLQMSNPILEGLHEIAQGEFIYRDH